MSEGKTDLEKLVRIYITMRSKKDELTKKYQEEVDELKQKMELVKTKLNEVFEEVNMDSISTKAGTAYRTVKTTYSINDWEGLYDFIEENKFPQVLQKRLNQGVLKECIDRYPTKIPRGLNSFSTHEITIRRKK